MRAIDYQKTRSMMQQLHQDLPHQARDGSRLEVTHEDGRWRIYESKFHEDEDGLEASCEEVADFARKKEALRYIQKRSFTKVKRKAGPALTAYFRALQAA